MLSCFMLSWDLAKVYFDIVNSVCDVWWFELNGII